MSHVYLETAGEHTSSSYFAALYKVFQSDTHSRRSISSNRKSVGTLYYIKHIWLDGEVDHTDVSTGRLRQRLLPAMTGKSVACHTFRKGRVASLAGTREVMTLTLRLLRFQLVQFLGQAVIGEATKPRPCHLSVRGSCSCFGSSAPERWPSALGCAHRSKHGVLLLPAFLTDRSRMCRRWR